MAILSFLTSLLSGGITGLLGAGLQRFADYMNKKQDIEIMKVKGSQDLAMREMDGKLMAQEWAARTQVVSIESEAKKDVAETEAFGKSLWQEVNRYSAVGTQSGWLIALDFLRGIIRPGLTLYLCGITTMVYLESKAMMKIYGEVLTGDQAFDLYSLIINTILYLTTTVILWWFGVQNKGKTPGTK